ncbi:indole-3-glycerol phosphate synthase TrpC [Segetibacter sp. 3557_3]|uniref:indole-3-glycerol phosphate synthase TrpC n=1 Tax=Segetibacter sp. 3557_3 TaxID=2547429 RepID=UPI001058F421|nr:indole-3-glycerol phosphate synthase TrpC [Segetibacter sp. 3557_3]TDH27847.1 indole-3-glycerol phosphate synthase TrpC [Segetibacter sp. 3557_3]
MNILDNIIATKKTEVEQKKALVPESELKTFPFYTSTCNSLVSQLLIEGGTGIIAEFKRKSPSKGVINDQVNIGTVVEAYESYGAAGISILTDEQYFGGSIDDLMYAREMVGTPILRKDFIIDEYQIIEAKAIGASVILLIAACLSPQRVQELALFAKRLSLEVLLEIHNEEELEHICTEVDIVGVNNRDLKTFTVDVNRSINLSSQIPGDKIKISESGISDVETISRLKNHGFSGFLIGETFMKQPDPAIAFADFVTALKSSMPEEFFRG